jgi:hypothetical protein
MTDKICPRVTRRVDTMRPDLESRNPRRRGVTLIELAIYIVVLAILGAPLITVTLTMSRASAEGDMTSLIIERNRAVMERIAGEVRECLHTTVSVSTDGWSLQFTPTTNFDIDTATPVAGAPIRYEIRVNAGETANGVDDDGDGLIDESSLYRISGGQEIMLTNAIKASGSSFSSTVSSGVATVAISLVTSGRARGDSGPLDVTRTLTVSPRN